MFVCFFAIIGVKGGEEVGLLQAPDVNSISIVLLEIYQLRKMLMLCFPAECRMKQESCQGLESAFEI